MDSLSYNQSLRVIRLQALKNLFVELLNQYRVSITSIYIYVYIYIYIVFLNGDLFVRKCIDVILYFHPHRSSSLLPFLHFKSNIMCTFCLLSDVIVLM